MMKFINTKNFYLLKIVIIFFLGNTTFAQENSIVIMFKNHVSVGTHNSEEPRFFTNIPEILYWDDQMGEDITPSKTNDTVHIITSSSVILLRNRYNVLSYCDFIFSNGDSVVINYVNGFPYPEVINRASKEYDFKVDFLIRQRLIKGKFDPINIYSKISSFAPENRIDDFKDKTSKSIIQYLNNQTILLDSLHQTGKLSDLVYDFHKNRISWLKRSNELQQNKLTQPAAAKLIQEKPNEKFQNKYRNEFIDFYIRKFYDNDAIRPKDVFKNYSRVKNDTVFDDEQKNRLLSKFTQTIIANSSVADAKAHFENFKKDVRNPFFTDRIYNLFRLKLSNSDAEFDVYKSSDLAPTKFEDVVKKHKYTYIDFWASWCAPCIKEMPSSKVLGEKYSDGKIGFVYISIDDDEKAWKKQEDKLGLDKFSSFLIRDSKDSKIMKKFAIKQIPRYIILNEKGEILDSNAPRPSDPKVYEVLDKLLKE